MHIDPIALRLNETLGNTVISHVLSSHGRRTYFPRGIVAQSQEAAGLASYANATAGVALEDGHHMTHELFSRCVPFLSPDELVSYAPTSGDMRLRTLWKEEMTRKNPSLANKNWSLPVVTAGLTHGISIAADLFVDPGDHVVVPAPSWDNYELIFSVAHAARLHTPSLFDETLRFSLDSLKETLGGIESHKIVLLLNFPNNPTGYTPSESEMVQLVRLLTSFAEEGKHLVVVVDDAYFGLFHDASASAHSLFSHLCDAHGNLLAVKCDAATKEALVWGLRVGFITYGARGLTNECLHAMVQKTMGTIRASVSSSSRAGQSLLLAAMQDPRYRAETARVARTMSSRFACVKAEVAKWRASTALRLYPCNSGYFCTFACAGDAEELRKDLLEHHGIGTVALSGNLVRIAYSGVDEKLLPGVIGKLYQCAEKLWT
jgi:aspartate/methionine/tyrosine aminotransferase